MNIATPAEDFGRITAPMTLSIQRHLSARRERVWDWLTDSDLRRRWLASGVIDQRPGASFELIWRNDDLTTPPGDRPEGMSVEHRATCTITDIDPPRRIAWDWPGVGHVTVTLEPAGERTLLTLVHARAPTDATLLAVSAGWHVHLDLLVVRVAGQHSMMPFWDGWRALREAYAARQD
jgi:uncharacterized protein YndB with AHSA1/START domain